MSDPPREIHVSTRHLCISLKVNIADRGGYKIHICISYSLAYLKHLNKYALTTNVSAYVKYVNTFA